MRAKLRLSRHRVSIRRRCRQPSSLIVRGSCPVQVKSKGMLKRVGATRAPAKMPEIKLTGSSGDTAGLWEADRR
jgi:hypothetical protein